MRLDELLTFADRLQYIIDLNGYSHNDIARLCGVKQGSVSYILAKSLKRSKLAIDIAKGLNVSSDWLISGTGSPDIEIVHRIPLFNNILDCVKFAQKKDFMLEQKYIYSKRNCLSQDVFAITHDTKIILICSCSQTVKTDLKLYLTVQDFLTSNVQIMKIKTNNVFFPILEIRIQMLDNRDKIQIGSLDVQ